MPALRLLFALALLGDIGLGSSGGVDGHALEQEDTGAVGGIVEHIGAVMIAHDHQGTAGHGL